MNLPFLESNVIFPKYTIDSLTKCFLFTFRPTDTTASFGEMLLLMAIHFHSSQLTWICDHMCNTLGMRINIRQSTMGKMKQIFTQDVFPEHVYIFD